MRDPDQLAPRLPEMPPPREEPLPRREDVPGSLGEAIPGRRFHGDNAQIRSFQFFGNEGEAETAKIAAAADAANQGVGRFSGELQLPLCFQTDDRLVKKNVVENAAQGVFRVVVRRCILNGFRDRDPEATRGLGIGRENASTRIRVL